MSAPAPNEKRSCEDCGESFDEPAYVECDDCYGDLPCCPICLAEPKFGCERCHEMEREILRAPARPK